MSLAAIPPTARVPLVFFLALTLVAFGFIIISGAELPASVASHFDAAGNPTSYMSHGVYFCVMVMALMVPWLGTTLLATVYSRAPTLKLPNRDYWMAPQRVAQTRLMLFAHALLFGCLLTGMLCYVNWLEICAHRRHPPHLPSELVQTGMLVFLIAMAVWICALTAAFRRKRS